jgi:hypothetical protein
MSAGRLALPLCAAALLGPASVAAGVTPQAQALDAGFLATAPAPPAPAAVCVVDTGVSPTPDLAGAISLRLNALGLPAVDDAEPTLHGTFVADAIAGRTAGIWPQATIVSVRAWAADSPQPFWRTYLAGIEACVAAGPPTKVINVSVADSPVDAHATTALAAAVADAWVHDMSVVVSAGNNDGAAPHTPADTPGAIAIGAADASGLLCGYSAQAPGLLTAPACPAVALTGLDGSALSLDGGTSLAAPQVSAVLAAMRAYQPTLRRQQAEDILRMSAIPGPAGTLRVDAGAAFRAAGLAGMTSPAAAPAAPVTAPATVQAVIGAPAPALARPRIARRLARRAALELRFRPLPRSARVVWGGARAHAIGRTRILFALGRRPRRAWVALTEPGRRSSPRLAIALPARQSAA